LVSLGATSGWAPPGLHGAMNCPPDWGAKRQIWRRRS